MKFKHVVISSLLLLSLYGCTDEKDAEKLLLNDDIEDIELKINDVSLKNILNVMKDNLEVSEKVEEIEILEQTLPLYKNKEGNIQFFISHSTENDVEVVDLLEINGKVSDMEEVNPLVDDLLYILNIDEEYLKMNTVSPEITDYSYTDSDISFILSEEKFDDGSIEFKIVLMPLFNPNK